MRFTLHCTVALAAVLAQNASAHAVQMTPQQDLFEDTETSLAQKKDATISMAFWGAVTAGTLVSSLAGYFVGKHTGAETIEEKSSQDMLAKDEELNELESAIETDSKKVKKNDIKRETLQGIQEQIRQAKAIETDNPDFNIDDLVKKPSESVEKKPSDSVEKKPSDSVEKKPSDSDTTVSLAESRQGRLAQQKQAGSTTQRARQPSMAQSKNVSGPVRANGRTIGVSQQQAGSVARKLNQHAATKMAQTNPYLAI